MDEERTCNRDDSPRHRASPKPSTRGGPGGDWLWAAPEYMATAGIARALHKLDKIRYVTMEGNIRKAIEYAGGSLVGRPNRRLNLGGRFDLVVWNTQGPRGLIEVKTGINGYKQVAPDIERLCVALNKAQDIRWGLVAYFASFAHGQRKDAANRVSDRTREIARRARGGGCRRLGGHSTP